MDDLEVARAKLAKAQADLAAIHARAHQEQKIAKVATVGVVASSCSGICFLSSGFLSIGLFFLFVVAKGCGYL
jgi:hypothetical protein